MKKFFWIFICILFLVLFFVDGVRLYVDNGWFPLTEVRMYDLIFSFLEPLRQWTYFWYDEYTLQSSRFLWNFLFFWWEIFLFALFFLINFVVSFKILRLFFTKTASYFWAFLYTFNPISFLFLNLSGFIFAYTSLPLVIFSFYQLLKTKRIFFLLLLVCSLYFFISYTRITGLYFVLFGFLILFYIKNIFTFLKQNILYSFFVVLFLWICFAPFVFSLFYPYLDWQIEYFSWLWNYATSSLSWADGFYEHVKSVPFYEALSLKEITDNFWKDFYNSFVFVFYSFCLIVGTLLSTLFLKNIQYRSLYYFIVSLFLLFIFFLVWAKFLNLDLFVTISYDFFPFIANNTKWLYVILLPFFVFIVVVLLDNIKLTSIKKIYQFILIVYFILIFYPLILSFNQGKLKIMSPSDFPEDYYSTFHSDKIEKNPSLFFPSHNLYFNWSPYPLSLLNNNWYVSLFSDNSRLVNEKQAFLINSLILLDNKTFLSKAFLFNLKNIFVFRNVKNPREGQFDFYPVKDYQQDAIDYFYFLKNNDIFYLKKNVREFFQFGIKNDHRYEYFLYSPRRILNYSVQDFFSTWSVFNLFDKPVNIDPDSFHKPSFIKDIVVPEENQNIALRYKKSVLQPTKIYLKIGNVDLSKPFLLQLNQTFGMSWKLKWISKEEFEEKECLDPYQAFEITQNKFCNYKPQILDIADTKYLNREWVPQNQHFEWNFVWNAWFILPENIPEDRQNEKELYVVILYEKQIWYNWVLILSWLTFFLVSLFAFIQFFNKSNEK